MLASPYKTEGLARASQSYDTTLLEMNTKVSDDAQMPNGQV